jgi:hypothetical protein
MNPNMRRPTFADAAVQLKRYFGWLEAQLADGRTWLMGSEPSIADFSVAQSVWFIRRAPPVATLLAPYRRLLAWYEHVQSLGHGESTPMTSEEAIAVARGAGTPAHVLVAPGEAFGAGAEVSVTPTDYAHDPVEGRLVGLDDDEVVIAREDSRAGHVQVHFPRIGYQVKAVTRT